MLTRLVTLASVSVLVIANWMGGQSQRLPHRDLPHDFTSPGLALQFAQTPEDVMAIVGSPSDPARTILRSSIAADTWLIIAYALLFLIGGFIALRRRRLGAWRFLGVLAIAGGLLAAWYDVRENAAMAAALDGEVPRAASFAYLKWTFFFVAMLGMVPMAWRKDGPGAAAALAFGFGGLAGLVALWVPAHPTALGPAAGAFGFGVVMLVLTPLNARVHGGFVGAVGRGVRRIDEELRFFDLWANRTVDGLLGKGARHTWAAIAVPALLVFFIVNGPAVRDAGRLGLAAVIGLVSASGFWWLLRVGARRGHSFQRDLVTQCLVVLAVIGGVWFLAPADATERSLKIDSRLVDGIPYEWLPYRHVLLAVVGLVAVALLIGSVLAKHLFGSTRGRNTVPGRLARVELFVSLPKPPPVTGSMFLLAAIGAVTRSPERVLFPASLAAVLINPESFLLRNLLGRIPILAELAALLVDQDLVKVVFFSVLGAALVLVAFTRLDARFSASWNLLHRVFFGGWSGVISVAVIVIGVARVLDVQYASTVLDGARSFTLGGYLLAAYAVTWWFDYWMSTAAAIRLLDLLGGRGGADDAQIAYPIAIHPSTSVPASGRVIQAHGAGRLLVLHDHKLKPNPFFHSYSLVEMTDGLCDGLKQKNPVRMDLDWTRWRLAAHMLLTSVILVVLLVGAGWLLHRRPQRAQIAAPVVAPGVVPPTPVGLDVRATVFPDAVCTDGTPVIAIAASGGGTRAALYTTAILELLYRHGQLPNVKVMSGVSGGGAALAYFAAHREQLLTDARAWDRFFAVMKEPYIEDVIDGSGEWRMASDDRLGRLLAESFERRWGTRGGMSIADIDSVGLLLNSAIAGQFKRDAKAGDSPSDSIGVIERTSGRPGSSDVAGGRVVYTNLNLADHFGNVALIDERDPRSTRDTRLPIFVVKGPHVKLAAATAANANFPPVFSNTAIDRDNDLRLWVTDGGAVDNRGTETLLMTLRNAVAASGTACPTLPPIHIVEVEASAFSDGYSQDRGIGSVMSAGTAFASQLDAELLDGLRSAVGSPDRVVFHYLPMPRLLRQSGSFGTHWMMQKSIRVCQDQKCRWSLALDEDEVVRLLRSLDVEANSTDEWDVLRQAHTLIRHDTEWPGNWSRLCEALAPGRC